MTAAYTSGLANSLLFHSLYIFCCCCCFVLDHFTNKKLSYLYQSVRFLCRTLWRQTTYQHTRWKYSGQCSSSQPPTTLTSTLTVSRQPLTFLPSHPLTILILTLTISSQLLPFCHLNLNCCYLTRDRAISNIVLGGCFQIINEPKMLEIWDFTDSHHLHCMK